MRVQIAAMHVDISEAMKEYAEARGEKMGHFFDRVTGVRIILNRDGDLYTAEMICSGVKGKALVSAEKHKDVFAAMDLVTGKMERQLTKVKEKIRGHHVKHAPKTNGTSAVEKPSSDQQEFGEDWL